MFLLFLNINHVKHSQCYQRFETGFSCSRSLCKKLDTLISWSVLDCSRAPIFGFKSSVYLIFFFFLGFFRVFLQNKADDFRDKVELQFVGSFCGSNESWVSRRSIGRQ